MFHWNPSCGTMEQWTPKGGWNAVFSEKHRISGTTLFFFLKNKKGCQDHVAEMIVHMVLYKQIYPGLRYSEEQEKVLQRMISFAR